MRTGVLRGYNPTACHSSIRDTCYAHSPTAPFSSISSFHNDQVLTKASAIYYEDFFKSCVQLSFKTNKQTKKTQQQTNKQKKALNSVELRRKVFRSRRNKLQLAKGTKSQPLTQFQTCAGTISKQIIQPVLEESLAQDLLHIAGTALSRKYFFSKGTPSEFTQNMTMCSTK